MLILHV